MMKVDLLRHGELVGGVKYRGQRVDDPLTDAGRKDMDRVWSHLEGKVDLIITSPLSRCAGPATAWADAAGIPCLPEPRILELAYGEWDGLSKDEIRARFPGMLERWRANPEGMCIPGAETMAALQERIASFWEDCVAQHAGKHLLVVGHSGSLRALIAHVLAAPVATTRRMSFPYASWSRVVLDAEGAMPALDFLNRRP